MPRLNTEQRRARDEARFRERVERRREEGADVVAYALANGRACKFLTKDERRELRTRRAERKARTEAKAAAEKRLHQEVVRCWKDFGAGNPPWEIPLQDDRCWDAAVRRLRAWSDHEAADLWRDTGSHTPDDTHPRVMRRIVEVTARLPARRTPHRG